MSKVKTISDAQENSIHDALTKLKRLESVADLMHNNTYRAAQRDILRSLVRHIVSTEITPYTEKEIKFVSANMHENSHQNAIAEKEGEGKLR